MDQVLDKGKTLGEKIVDQVTNKEQSPYQLEGYLASPYLSMESLNNWKGSYPEAFTQISEEIFLLIVDYLNDSNRRTLGQVCKPFFTTIWLE
jgi:hypothetical protein